MIDLTPTATLPKAATTQTAIPSGLILAVDGQSIKVKGMPTAAATFDGPMTVEANNGQTAVSNLNVVITEPVPPPEFGDVMTELAVNLWWPLNDTNVSHLANGSNLGNVNVRPLFFGSGAAIEAFRPTVRRGNPRSIGVNGAGAYVTMGASPSAGLLGAGLSFTIFIWYRAKVLGATRRTMTWDTNMAFTNNSVEYPQGTKRFEFPDLPLEKQTFIAFTKDVTNQQYRLNVNGVSMVSQLPWSDPAKTGGAQFMAFGNGGGAGTGGTSADISDFGAFYRALSPDDVAKIYAAGRIIGG